LNTSDSKHNIPTLMRHFNSLLEPLIGGMGSAKKKMQTDKK
jgi:hypothetical protein